MSISGTDIEERILSGSQRVTEDIRNVVRLLVYCAVLVPVPVAVSVELV